MQQNTVLVISLKSVSVLVCNTECSFLLYSFVNMHAVGYLELWQRYE